MALGEEGIELVRPVKYSLKPLHYLQKVQKAKTSKDDGQKNPKCKNLENLSLRRRLSQAVHNLGISWSARRLDGNLLIFFYDPFNVLFQVLWKVLNGFVFLAKTFLVLVARNDLSNLYC